MPFLSFSIDAVFSPAFIKSSFRKAGLIPFNPDMIDKSMLVPEDFQKKKVPSALTNPGPSICNPSTEDSVQEATSQTAISIQSNVCKECGASKAPHPLISVQKLPKELQSVFIVPLSSQPPKKKRKVVTEARIITGDKMLEQLEFKEKEEDEKRAGIERRKKEREEKRRQRRKETGKGKSKVNGEKERKTVRQEKGRYR
ncbi:heavy metal-associated isoprenylated plant protein 4-like [Pecten maximus]|uniref:heavy metal-associated isoprenylated plant protein 4-like n=1 Tax=Pecten maximus TaxID=6579 RepID=UPI001458E89A|nr:heavy metal-associated isoprenylated plant protein 4-like [Pecten maximus]